MSLLEYYINCNSENIKIDRAAFLLSFPPFEKHGFWQNALKDST